MVGKNHGLCHSCRCKGHFFPDCPKKRLCLWCKRVFVKCFEVEKETNKGRLFKCCGGKCGFCEWVGDGKNPACESSVDSATIVNAAVNESVADITGLFESSLRLGDEQEFKHSVKVTIRNNNITSEVNGKEKTHA